ncbi:granzyme A-like [Polypterus senegalus]|uniref:granzyme A-like n=1 Tax=Polypterus senegalus TaxID=55291 RepID=UPI001964A7EB|nr:granzyme A-like [Polypterus senegalus]
MKQAVILLFMFLIREGGCVEIVGGWEVKPHSKPYMAFLTNYCGGALIKPNWVLTAAHCHEKNIIVILGAHSLTENEETKQFFRVKSAIIHPQYNPKKYRNDIMLLQLSQNAQLGKSISTLSLPDFEEDVKAGTKCSIAGWGTTRYNGSMVDKLREVTVTVIDRDDCNGPNYYEKIEITRNMLCAGNPNGGKDACQGDSGGPLLCDGVFRGIISFGENCGLPNKPGVYVLITKEYLEWIEKVIEQYG